MTWNPRHAYTNTPDAFFFGRPWQCQMCGRPVHPTVSEEDEFEWDSTRNRWEGMRVASVKIECHGETYRMEKRK